jgi:two-component system cell cycle sensor histidine kinase/response regulator CckA
MRTILVVDDEAIVVDVIKSVLEMWGYHLLTAENSTEAFRICEAHPGPIDLLVTNHRLKTESGRQVTDRIRPLQPNIKVLQISGWPEELLSREGTRIPGSVFLQKPFSAPALINKVRELLDISS